MWTGSSLTIVFRGLLVMHEVRPESGPSYFEVGVVPDDHHVLRINTIKNGVLASVTNLEARVDSRRPRWRLQVANPLGGVSTHTAPGGFRRRTHRVEEDYRWITDLAEVFDDPNVEDRMDTSVLRPVVRIDNGVFYTRLKSPTLRKLVDGAPFPFGALAGVVGCDIPAFGGGARLVNEQEPERPIFNFEPGPNTIYEFSNAPPDVEVPHDPHHRTPGADAAASDVIEAVRARAPEDCADDHFLKYYKLFRNPADEPVICFTEPDEQPAPDPALCGPVGSRRPVPFGGGDELAGRARKEGGSKQGGSKQAGGKQGGGKQGGKQGGNKRGGRK
ncbi:MAG TPA: hypothetical protein VIP46_05350 [Pyrinomonadaceae bacterium]